MRLRRTKESRERDLLLVGVVPPPTVLTVPVTADLERLFVDAYERLHGPSLDHAECSLSADDARDAVADAMVALWLRWATLTPGQRSDKWIFGVVHRCVRAKRRANRRANRHHVSLDEAEAALERLAASTIPDLTGRDTAADVLDLALSVMPPRRREVLLLVKEAGFTYAEAAEELGLSVGTINTHMRLATKDLSAAFTRAGFRLANPQPARLMSPKGGATHD